MSTEPETFLARWSRRKRAAEREAEPPAEVAVPAVVSDLPAKVGGEGVASGGPVPAPAPVGETGDTAEVPLPSIESLEGLRSDYTAFFQQPVGEDLRRAALKKLFADPHFNQMDMLDVYVDDYTQFEPLPAALRMRLPSARAFLLDSELAALEAAEATTRAAGDAPEPAMAAAGGECGPADGLDADREERGLAVDDASAESTSPLTAAPDAAPVDVVSAEDPAEPVNVSTLPVIPPGKSTAPDPSST
jgi:hypothetical protein